MSTIMLRTRKSLLSIHSRNIIFQTPYSHRSYSTKNTKRTSENQDYDVLIVGGGLVGTSMACALQQSPYTRELKIGLVDQQLERQLSPQSQRFKYHKMPPSSSSSSSLSSTPQSVDGDGHAIDSGTPGIRVSAIAKASQTLFERMGVWQKLNLKEHPITPYDKMEVWDEIGGGVLRFNAREQKHMHNLGHIVDNDLLLGAILQRLQEGNEENEENESPNATGETVDFIFDSVRDVVLTDPIGASRETIQWSEKLNISEFPIHSRGGGTDASNLGASDLAHAFLGNGDVLRAQLIIAADGANSPIRNRLNIPTTQSMYDQRAFVCSVETAKSHNTAFQRFLKTGPIAMLPVGHNDKYSNIVWSTTPEHAKWLECLSPDQLVDAINVAFHDSTEVTDDNYSNIVDRFVRSIETRTQVPKLRGAYFSTDIPPRPPTVVALLDQHGRTPNSGSFPLRRQHAQQYVKPKMALIGDAAHTCHPIAGQGVNMGIADVARLTHALQRAIQSGTRLGDALLLRQEYEKPQHRRNEMMLEGLEIIKNLFAINHDTLPGFPFVRALGMLGLNNISVAKDWFIGTAIGGDIDVAHIGYQQQQKEQQQQQ